MIPETKYARSGTIHIAYHVFGKGPIDLVFMPGWASNIEVYWEEPTVARFLERLVSKEWGGPLGLSVRAPSMMNDERFRRWWAKYLRASASPATMQAFINMTAEIDIRPILPSIQVPTLLMHATGDRSIPVECSRYMVNRIPGAKLIELPTEDHLPFIGCPEEILNEVEQFLTGSHTSAESQRVLATVMFTDIVDSTSINVQLGDVRWRDLLEAHNTVIRQELAVYRGQEMNTTGDGFYATFDGPARAIQCACAITAQMQSLNLPIRAGIHTGECVITGDTVEGIAVHIGARVAATAGANQVVVSQTVKDLVVGSSIEFDDHGVHVLKGVPDQWHLYSVKSV